MSILDISEGITYIESYAFEDMKNLEKISLPSSALELGAYAFSGCSKLSGIKIPENISTINQRTFEFCGALKMIELPKNLKKIAQLAFYNAAEDAKLQIYYMGTEEDKNNIEIDAKSNCF